MADKNNMELWNSVCTTNPSDTKKVNQRGGFTAICAQSQIKAATEQWGPYGGTWGLHELVWGEIRNAAGELVEITLQGNFQYPSGMFPIAADAAYKAGNDTRKKLMTDATTKALSKLGFNADVFLGLFDDNKYVAEQRAKTQNTKPTPQQPPAGDIGNDIRKLVAKYGKNPVGAASELIWGQKYIPKTVDELTALTEKLVEIHGEKA